MKSLFFILLVIGLAGCDCGNVKLNPITECGKPCAPWNDAGTTIGACQAGTWACSDDGSRTCVGFVSPSQEDCDGVDNDCDGKIDEWLARACTGACGGGTQRCTEGAWGACTAREPAPETCNGIDDDCDGEIDEPQDLPVEFCYTGPTGTVTKGVCHPGSRRCFVGQLLCFGEQTPIPEVCDGLDQDCNGLTDDGLDGGPRDVDIVFIIDTSCSMGTSIWEVRTATSAWGLKYQNRPELRMGLVTAPDPDTRFGSTPRLFLDLGPPQGLAQAMTLMTPTGSGAEDQLTAIGLIISPINPLAISWRPGARRVVILFSDEWPQDWTSNPPLTAFDVATEAVSAGVVVHVFTDPLISPSWVPMTSVTGGKLSNVGRTAKDIEAELDTTITESTCAGGK